MLQKTAYRLLNTLYNLGTSAEPNLTILWSTDLPENLKLTRLKFLLIHQVFNMKNDDLIRPIHGDDYGIACCVSPMAIGKEMQFFGARANAAKALLYALNGGKDEISGVQVFEKSKREVIQTDYLDYNEVLERFNETLKELARSIC